MSPEHGSRQPEDDLYLAIGRVAANWSLLEVVSGLVLMGLVGSRDETVARAVVAGQRVENVWDTIDALLATYGDGVSEQLSEFRAWRRAANTCRRRRNEAIHSAWSLTSSSGKPAAWDMMSQKAKQGARADLFPGGVVELGELAQDIAGLEARLAELHGTIFFPPKPSFDPDRPPHRSAARAGRRRGPPGGRSGVLRSDELLDRPDHLRRSNGRAQRMPSFVAQAQHGLHGPAVDGRGVEMAELQLRPPEHPERPVLELTPAQVHKAFAAAVDERAHEPPVAHDDLELEEGQGRIAGHEVDHLRPALHSDVDVLVGAPGRGGRPAASPRQRGAHDADPHGHDPTIGPRPGEVRHGGDRRVTVR